MAIAVNQQGLSFVQYLTDGVAANFPFSFNYLKAADIKVYVNSAEVTYTFLNANEITPDSLPASADIVTIRRFTEKETRIVNFEDGAQLSETVLDLDSNQLFYLAQETQDISNFGLGVDPLLFTMDARGYRIINVGDAEEVTDGVNLGQLNALETAVGVTTDAIAIVAQDAVDTADAATVTANAASITAGTALSTANAIDAKAQTALDNSIAAELAVDTHILDLANPHVVTKTQVGLGNADNTSDLNKPISTATQDALDDKVDSVLLGAPLGIATLNGTGFINSSQLPSYVDDIEEYTNYTVFPVTGETGKIYVDVTAGTIYRWSGTVYVALSSGGGGLAPWITTSLYELEDVIFVGIKLYKCIVAHTSGTFAVDLAAAKWVEMVLPQQIETTSTPSFSDVILTDTQFNNSEVGRLLAHHTSTGVVGGAVLTINATTSLFDLSAQNLVFANNTLVSDKPVIKHLTCGPFTAQMVTNIATTDVTHILVDDTCTLSQQSTQPTPNENRAKAYIGRLNHVNRTNINSVFSTPNYAVSPTSQMYDLFDAIGAFNVNGNIVTPNGANLSIDRSSGTMFRRGLNYTTDDQNPHEKTFIAATIANFFRTTRTNVGTSTFTTLDVSNYDLAGTVTAIPGGGGTATNQRVFLLASGNLSVQYGQNIYTSLANAVAAIPNEAVVANQSIVDSGVLIGIISCRKDATNASLSTQCNFSKVARFDSSGVSVGSNSVATLQSAYDNSVTPQITTSTALGSVDMKRGSAADSDAVLRILSAAGKVNAQLTGDGRLTTLYSDPGNMVKNGSFELTDITDWTCAVGTCARTTTSGEFSSGNAALKVSLAAQSMNVSQTITTPSGIMKQGFARFTYRIPATGVVTPTITITVDSTLQVTIPSDKLLMDGMFHQIEVPFIFGSTDVKVSYLTGSSTGDVFIDLTGVYQGLGLQNLQGDTEYSAAVDGVVSPSTVSGENTNWLNGNCTRTATGIYDCPTISGLFSAVPNCIAVRDSTSTGGGLGVIYDKTNSTTNSLRFVTNTEGSIAYNSKIIVSCQKSGNDYLAASSQVYSQASANYDWTNYNATFTGLGTVAPSTNNCKHKRDGGDLLVDCYLTSFTPAASLVSISLPNGLTIDPVKVQVANTTASAGQAFGTWTQNALGGFGAIVSATGTSTSFVYAGQYVAANNMLIPQNGNTTFVNSPTSFRFRVPISGWSNSSSIVGSFAGVPAVPGYEGKVDTFSVSYGTTNATTVCSASPCSYLDQIGNAVSSITRVSAGSYNLNTVRTYAKLKCTQGSQGSSVQISGTPLQCTNCNTVPFQTYSFSATIDNSYGTLVCQGTY